MLSLYWTGLDALGSARPLDTEGGAQVLGASKASAHKALVPTPKQGDHKTSVKNAQQIGKQAVAAGQKLLQQVKQKSKRTKTKGKKLATGQLTKIANNLVAHGQKLLKQAGTHKKTVQTVAAKQKAGATASKKTLKTTKTKIPAQKTNVHGEVVAWEQILGDDPEDLRDYLIAYVEVLGDGLVTPPPTIPTTAPATTTTATGAPPTPDPTNPGLMTDGTVDPSFATGAVAQDPMVQYYTQALATYPAQPTTAPPKDPSTYTHDPDPTSPQTDATYYKLDSAGNITDSNGTPILSAFPYDENPSLGRNSQASLASASKWSGGSGYYQFSSDGWQTHRPSWDKYYRWSGPNGTEKADFNAASIKNNWGPIIGNPNGPFKGLRFATDGSGDYTPFFFYDTAPARFLTADNTVLLAQAVTDWQTNKTALEQQLSAAVVQAQLQQQQSDAATQQQAAQTAQAATQAQTDQQAETTQAAQIQTQSDATAQQEQAAFQQASDAQQAQADQAHAQADADADATESDLAAQYGQPDPHAPPPAQPPVVDPSTEAPSAVTAIWDSIFGEHVRGVDEVIRRRKQQ